MTVLASLANRAVGDALATDPLVTAGPVQTEVTDTLRAGGAGRAAHPYPVANHTGLARGAIGWHLAASTIGGRDTLIVHTRLANLAVRGGIAALPLVAAHAIDTEVADTLRSGSAGHLASTVDTSFIGWAIGGHAAITIT